MLSRIRTAGRILGISWLLLLPCLGAEPGESPGYTRTEDLIYGRKFGTALTLDVFEPAKKNGGAVIVIVSGGFFSAKEAINPGFCVPFLKRGYTCFAVVHGSQPRYIIPEIQQDIHRAVRWIRTHAGQWGIDRDKFAVFGASAGGHLTLLLATQGGPGASDAKDPVDRESSAVQVAACFFPPTDYSNWSRPGDDACGVGRLTEFKPAFGPRSDTAEGRTALSREISPLTYVSGKMAPTLIFHGDADTLVPLYQSEIFAKKATAAGATCKLVVIAGGQHGWPGLDKNLETFADWFDEYLRNDKGQ